MRMLDLSEESQNDVSPDLKNSGSNVRLCEDRSTFLGGAWLGWHVTLCSVYAYVCVVSQLARRGAYHLLREGAVVCPSEEQTESFSWGCRDTSLQRSWCRSDLVESPPADMPDAPSPKRACVSVPAGLAPPRVCSAVESACSRGFFLRRRKDKASASTSTRGCAVHALVVAEVQRGSVS